MYDKAATALPLTGAAGVLTNSITVALIGMAIIGVGFAILRLVPKKGEK